MQIDGDSETLMEDKKNPQAKISCTVHTESYINFFKWCFEAKQQNNNTEHHLDWRPLHLSAETWTKTVNNCKLLS